MAKKKRPPAAPKPASPDKPSTLKDLLSPEVVDRLKAQAAELKTQEEKRKEESRKQAEEDRKLEQKRLESNFEYLLENSSQDWRKYK